jgi:hypothetical protein
MLPGGLGPWLGSVRPVELVEEAVPPSGWSRVWMRPVGPERAVGLVGVVVVSSGWWWCRRAGEGSGCGR